MLAFPSTADAVKFCHAIQVHLMYAKYPIDAAAYISPPATGPDGKWVFHGPRLGLAVHRGSDYMVSGPSCCAAYHPGTTQSAAMQCQSADAQSHGGELPAPAFNALQVTCSEEEGPRCPISVITYRGDTLEKTQLLCKVARGGQVVLSDVAWSAVKADIAAHCTSHMVGPSASYGIGLQPYHPHRCCASASQRVPLSCLSTHPSQCWLKPQHSPCSWVYLVYCSHCPLLCASWCDKPSALDTCHCR